MADKGTLSIRLALSGDDQVKSKLRSVGDEGDRQFGRVASAAESSSRRVSRFFSDTTRGSASLVRMNAAVDAFVANGGKVAETTRLFGLSRIGILELQAAGVNAFQALASGMSPMRVAFMEGSQAAGAFAQGGLGIKGILSALLGPFGLVTAAVATLGGGYLLLRDRIGGTLSVEEAHKQTEEAMKLLLGDTAKSADDLAKSYKGLSAEMAKVEEISILGAQRKANEELRSLRKSVEDTVDGVAAERARLFNLELTVPGAQLTPELQRQLDMTGPLDRAIAAFQKSGSVSKLAIDLHDIAQAAGASGDDIEKLAESLTKGAKSIDAIAGPKGELEQLKARMALLHGTATQAQKDLIGTGNGHKKTATSTRAHTSALEDFVSQLEAEIATSGMAERERAALLAVTRASADAQRDYNAGLRDSPLLTEQEADAIRNLARTKFDAAQADKSHITFIKAETKGASSAARELGLTFSSAFEDAVARGRSLRDVLQGIAQDISRIILRKTVTEPLGNAFSSFLGNLGGNLFGVGGLFGPASNTAGLGVPGGEGFLHFGGPRASGGRVEPGKWYMVGESGPEPFVPDKPGTIIPNNAMRGAAGAPVVVNFYNNVDARGADTGVDQRVMQALKAVNKDIEARAVAAVTMAVRRDPNLLGRR